MNYDECNAKMRELEQLFKIDPDTALKSMIELFYDADNVRNHEVADAIGLWVQGEMKPNLREYIVKKSEDLEALVRVYRGWLDCPDIPQE